MTKHNLGAGPDRRTVLAAGLLAPLAAPAVVRAASPEFSLKFATGQAPTHPNNVRMREAIDRIRDRTAGRIEIRLFPANQLGTETDVLSQLRVGGIELLLLSASILATLVPVAGIANTAYAFPEYDAVWKAMDGGLGRYTRAQIEKVGLLCPAKVWDNGFRQITASNRDIREPRDLLGFKVRVPPAPMLTSFFATIGASPTPMNFAEVYAALQTHVIDGQENALSLIETTKLYEVQRFCSMTGHSWDGYWPLANRRAWGRLPDDLKTILVTEFDRSVLDQRADLAERDRTLQSELTAKGMAFRDVDKAQFRAVLAKTSYYTDWKARYGTEAWSELEAVCGKLA
ncbi:TRAP transporter substrate-binding protein [Lichenibacterium dinghuense]|uniref:TRAP transporter substrate-binding protein n=1 Tax=Lichenibacterium dinghuense TaxID=2895977 RepID=UPI001F2E21C3|nr:TRAP transporter substrate-binding protein [Lichenibacterium sp. 6Y81]